MFLFDTLKMMQPQNNFKLLLEDLQSTINFLAQDQ